jgi:hypothetical protein
MSRRASRSPQRWKQPGLRSYAIEVDGRKTKPHGERLVSTALSERDPLAKRCPMPNAQFAEEQAVVVLLVPIRHSPSLCAVWSTTANGGSSSSDRWTRAYLA